MESKLRNTVLQLKDGSYIHHSKVQRYNKFGYQAIFVNRDKGFQFQVLYFSKSVLELNALTQHLNKTIARFKTLSSRKITPILEVQQKKQQIFVISPNYQHNLSQLIAKREGLSEFQVAYFLGELYELMGYLKSRDVFIQKIEAQDLSLTQQLKLTMGFSLFLNTIGQRSIIKRLPFRIQYRNRNNCPDLFFKKEISAITIDEVSSWITGILAYQIVQNKLPFPHVNDDLIGRARGCKTEEVFDLLDRQYVLHFKEAEQYTELIDLIKKLLKPNPSQRLKFSFVIIHPFIKKFPIPPHILPTTVFFCPPSQSYKEQYFKKFLKEDRQRGNEAIKDLRALTTQQNLRSQKQIKGFADFEKQKFTKSQFEICSQRVLSENFVMIEQFADISDVFGYGYQMNTGMVGFVFNDETQFLCLNGSQQIRARTNAKRKQEVVYSQQKLPEEDEIRKKIHILEAFVKTLKRKKISASEKQKTVMVSSYCRTKYASVFLLTNNALQVFFNDKIVFYLMKEETYIQHKNSDKFQKYDKDSKDQDLKNRRQYCITVAQKVFLWQTNTQTTILDNSMNDIPQE